MDNKTFQIAQNYALSLFEISLEHDDESFQDNLNLVAIELINNTTFQNFTRTPHISIKEKFKALKNAFEKSRVDVLIQKFILTLVQNRRFYLLPAILVCFKKIKSFHNRTCKITAISANQLEEGVKIFLENSLAKVLQKPIAIRFKEDRSLIGGLVIEFDKYVIDASIRGKIDKILTISC